MLRNVLTGFLCAACITQVCADDWPTLGRDRSRNSVSPESNPPLSWQVKGRDASSTTDASATAQEKNIRWTAHFEGRSFATPVVAKGLVWLGIAAGSYKGDQKPSGVLRCLRESDGSFVYERCSAALPERVHDAGWTGTGSSPLVEGESLWYVTNRWEVVCLDIGPLLRSDGPPKERWTVDLAKEFEVFPRATVMGPPRHCSIAPSYGDRIFVTTGNGVDERYAEVPAPQAPALACLDKNTGKTFWVDASPGANVHSTEAASPLVAEIAGRAQVIVPQGDGWLRSFDAANGAILWAFDLNRKDALLQFGGRGNRNHSWSCPVLYEDRIYVTTGQEVEHGEGPGRLVCIDSTKGGDISAELAVDRDGKPLPERRVQAVIAANGERAIPNPNSGLIWEFDATSTEFERQFHRSLSSVTIQDGLLIASDISGLIHCLDARTGKWHWSHDQLSACRATPLVVDGHVFVPDEDGDVTVLRLSADPQVAIPAEEPINMSTPINGSPVFANGTLYITTQDKLYAIGRGREPRAPKAIFVPTPHDVVAEMLKAARVTEKDLVVDLGSGDGRILIAAAKSSGAKAIGYEIDESLVQVSRENVKEAGLEKQVTVQEQDFYKADFGEATVVAAFLYPAVLDKLRAQFAKLKPGTRIVVHTFEIPGAKPDETIDFALPNGGDRYPIYLYKTPLHNVASQAKP